MTTVLYIADLNPCGGSFYKYNSLKELDYKVIGLSHSPKHTPGINNLPIYVQFMEKIGYPLDIMNINKRLISATKKYKPDIILIEKTLMIKPKTLEKIKKEFKKTKLVCYCVDNMEKSFNNSVYFKSCIIYYDSIFISTCYSKDFYYSLGAKKVIYVDKGYNSNLISLRNENQPYEQEVVFIGSYEKQRCEFIQYLSEKEIDVTVWGNGWKNIPSTKYLHIKNKPVYTKDYIKKMHSSKIVLHFLRQINNDLTDSRTYEIPASGSFMLAERNKEHLRLFKENKEAVFFDSKEELLEKVKYYLTHEKERNKIAEAGYKHCMNSKYSYKDRLKFILKKLR